MLAPGAIKSDIAALARNPGEERERVRRRAEMEQVRRETRGRSRRIGISWHTQTPIESQAARDKQSGSFAAARFDSKNCLDDSPEIRANTGIPLPLLCRALPCRSFRSAALAESRFRDNSEMFTA